MSVTVTDELKKKLAEASQRVLNAISEMEKVQMIAFELGQEILPFDVKREQVEALRIFSEDLDDHIVDLLEIEHVEEIYPFYNA